MATKNKKAATAAAAAGGGKSLKGDNAKKKAALPQHPNSFDSLHQPRPLSEGVLRYVREQGFVRMTPVQAVTIPQFLSHKDVAVQAQTGSGKTLAFLIPIVELIRQKTWKRPQIGALVLAPTRELAQQTYQVAKGLFASCGMTEPLLLVGGGSSSSSGGGGGGSSSNTRPVTADLQAFRERGSDLIVGTPGRVNDILSRYAVIDCSELECLVLDEADVLLSMGFSTTLQEILGRLPKMRRTALFSATQSGSTSSTLTEWMKRMGMRNPVWIDVAVASKSDNNTMESSSSSRKVKQKQQATPSSLTNYFVVTRLDEKLSRLAAFLQQHSQEKMIVFFLTCASVDFFGSAFQKLFPNLSIELLHGKMVQKRREKTMERFRSSEGLALFCTDVAARGLDITSVNWVVQVDSPQDPAFFVHRVGRSARAGKTGQSLIFLAPKEEAYVDLLRMRNIPLEPLPCTERCCVPAEAKDEERKTKSREKDNAPSKVLKPIKSGDSESTKKTRMIRSAADPELILEDVLPRIRDVVLKDRDMLEKGTKAFTSYIRAYKEHHCAFIFR